MNPQSAKQNKKSMKIFVQNLLDFFVKANYHEYPVMDNKGNTIGSEFVTTHVGVVIQPNKITKDDESDPNSPSTMKQDL